MTLRGTRGEQIISLQYENDSLYSRSDEHIILFSRVELLWKTLDIAHFHQMVTSNNYWKLLLKVCSPLPPVHNYFLICLTLYVMLIYPS